MTRSEKIIDYVEHCGGVFILTPGGGLEVDLPAGVLTPELRAELREHKDEIVDALVRREAEATFAALNAYGYVCWGCSNLAGKPMVIVKDKRALDGLPPELQGQPVFAVAEVEKLAAAGVEGFRVAYEVKAKMPGATVAKVNPPPAPAPGERRKKQ
jgi:hypothetical protein